jgi:hypothetical protein
MAKNCCGKRPCSICRKWFVPDARQKGRQKTCGPVCRREHHRRQCERLNKKNRADYANNYLTKKLEKAVEQQPPINSHSFQRETKPVLPMDVIAAEYGVKSAVIVTYLVNRIIDYTHVQIGRSP